MAGPHTARAQARAQMLEEIKARAWVQVAADGAGALSLRALARDLGLVSSAIYRYYANRDELLTALIVDAYADLARVLVAVDDDVPADRIRERWVRRALELRRWARAEPARFQLVYGTPVPGYRAPQDTVAPSLAVVVAFLSVLPTETANADDVPAELRRQLDAVATGLELTVPPARLARGVAAFAELVGLVVLELGGHFVGGFEPADALYAHLCDDLADRLDLPTCQN